MLTDGFEIGSHLEVGQKIKVQRTKLSYSQEELAFKAGIDRSYIGFVERGEKNPTPATLVKISRALKIPLKELFE